MKNDHPHAFQRVDVAHSDDAPHIALLAAFRNGRPLVYGGVIMLIVGAFIYLVCFRTMNMLIQMDRSQQHLAAVPSLSTSARSPSVSQTVILIAADGTVSIGGATVTDLAEAMQQRLKNQPADDMEVTIEADEKAAYDHVIAVLNALAKAQIKNVTFEVTDAMP